MRSEKQRKLKLVDDNDPIWNWILFIGFLAAIGAGCIIVAIYKAVTSIN